jgi:hypothetical protein
MRKSGLANILCDNELIVAQIVDEEAGHYKSLNITMGEVNVYDIIEAKPNEDGVLEMVKVTEEGIPHKAFFAFKDQDAWTDICIKATEFAKDCIIQGLAMPKNKQPGVLVMAYEEGFDPEKAFGDLLQIIS